MTAAGPPADEEELEELLSRPTDAVLETLRTCPGDVVVLGAGGKMGPTLTRMLKRAADQLADARTVFGVSRFSSDRAARELQDRGVTVVRADLSDPRVLSTLPNAPNVIYMAGQKFGTSDRPEVTWHTNVAVPAFVSARYASARIVAFSTGNVYPLTPPASGGSRESDDPAPGGEYAMSCLGRERIFQRAASQGHASVAIIRLNYAVDLRYGVLVDIAQRIVEGRPVNLGMGWFNCIWQRDANAIAIASLSLASRPATVLNVTGPELLSVRQLAESIARYTGKRAHIEGTEAGDALLSNVERMLSIFGEPTVPAQVLVEWVSHWVARGGAVLNKPTHFEERGGAF